MKSSRSSPAIALDVLTSGREFYDDGYTEQEQNEVNLPSTYQPVPIGSPSSSIYRASSNSTRNGNRTVHGNDNSSHDGGFVSHITKPSCDATLSASTATDKDTDAGASSEMVHQPFFGRTAEINKLKSIQRRIMKDSSDSSHSSTAYPAVLVWGTSGTGKSCMIEQFIDETCCTCKAATTNTPSRASADADNGTNHCSCCYVLRGKYDEGTGGSEPFSGIIQALDDLAMQLRHGPQEELDRVRSLIRNAFSNNRKRASKANNAAGLTHNIRNDDEQAKKPGADSGLELSGLTTLVPSLSILLSAGGSMTSPSIISQSSFSLATRSRTNPHDDQASLASVPISASSSSGSSRNAWNRLQYVFIQFMKAISTPTKPIYLFLDDLQWSSPVGLELLAALISDSDMDSFMLLGAIRQDTDPHNDEIVELEVDAPLRTSFLDRLVSSDDDDDAAAVDVAGGGIGANAADTHQGEKNSSGTGQHASGKAMEGHHQPHLEQITIANLSLDDTTQWLSDMFDRSQDDADLRVLTKKLHKKTRGNVLFTLQAIEELKRKNIIVFSRITFMWEWNLPKKNKHQNANVSIGFKNNSAPHGGLGGTGHGGGSDVRNDDDDDDDDDDLPISDNIVAIIESQLRQLPDDVQHVLSIAAYIRARFDLFTLYKVLEHEQAHGANISDTSDTHAGGHTSPNSRKQATDRPAQTGFWTQSRVASILQQAVTERLVIKSSTAKDRYQFVHDRIQQAAAGLVPYGEIRDKLRVRIGHCLLDMCTASQLLYHSHRPVGGQFDHQIQHINLCDSEVRSAHHTQGSETNVESLQMEDSQEQSPQYHPHPSQQDGALLFVAADHLNSVQTKDHLFSVTMNLCVGEKALQMAALATAAGYLYKASNSLKRVRKPWEDHYDLSLQLCQARAEVELSLGHFELGYRLCNEVFAKAKTLDQKLQTYFLMAHTLGRENKHVESLSLSLSVVRTLNVLPRRCYLMHITRDILKITSYLKNHTDDEILELPLLDDQRMGIAMRIGTELVYRCMIVNDSMLFLLQGCKLIKMTLKYGICVGSAMGFMVMDMIFDRLMNDYASAVRCANIAQRMMELAGWDYFAGLVDVGTNEYIYRFSLPNEEIDRLNRSAYHRSMKAGDFEVGLLILKFRYVAHFLQECTLQEMGENIEHALQQSQIYRVTSMDETSITLLRLSKTLRCAEKIDWARIEVQSQRDLRRDPPDLSRLYDIKWEFFTSSALAYYDGRHELSYRLMRLFRHVADKNEPFQLIKHRLFLSGLTASAMYKQTKQRMYRRKLCSQLKTLRTIVANKGDSLCLCKLLMEAEHASLSDANGNPAKIQKVLNAYEAVIQTAIKEPSMQITALGYDLAAEYLIRCKEQAGGQRGRGNGGDGDGSGLEEIVSDGTIRQYLLQALDHYHAWGCRLRIEYILRHRREYVGNWHPTKPEQKIRTSEAASHETMDGIALASDGSSGSALVASSVV